MADIIERSNRLRNSRERHDILKQMNDKDNKQMINMIKELKKSAISVGSADFWILNFDNYLKQYENTVKCHTMYDAINSGLCADGDKTVYYYQFDRVFNNKVSRKDTCVIIPNFEGQSICPGHIIFKNLRFSNESDIDKIESVELEIGDQIMDRVHTSVFPQLRKIYKINDKSVIPIQIFINGVPRIEHFNYRLNIITKKGYADQVFTVLLDGYNSNSYNEMTFLEIPFFQEQFPGSDIGRVISNTDNRQKVNIGFNHPVYYLIVKTSKKCRCSLRLDNLLEIPLESDENGIVYLTPSMSLKDCAEYGLNFSQFNMAELIMDTDEHIEVEVYAVSIRMLTCRSGMAGISYSK